MFGDICTTCSTDPCTCNDTEETPSPCLPGPSNAECETYADFKCLFWMGDPIAGTPIKKYTKGTEVVFYLLQRIKALEDLVAGLNAPSGFIVSLAAPTTLTFTWNATPGASNYIIERSATSNFSVFVQRYSGPLLTFQDTGLTASTTYYYRLKAQGVNYVDSLYSSVTGITTV